MKVISQNCYQHLKFKIITVTNLEIFEFLRKSLAMKFLKGFNFLATLWVNRSKKVCPNFLKYNTVWSRKTAVVDSLHLVHQCLPPYCYWFKLGRQQIQQSSAVRPWKWQLFGLCFSNSYFLPIQFKARLSFTRLTKCRTKRVFESKSSKSTWSK